MRTLAAFALCLCLLYLSAGPITRVGALIPKECAHNVTHPLAVCCPLDTHNGLVCGGPKRGHCERVIAPSEKVPVVFQMDDRGGWPTRFFSYACQCYGNFFGTSCDECWFGWGGKHCDKRKMLVRRNIRTLSPFQLKVFIDVIVKSRTWPSGYMILDESDSWHSDPLFKPKLIDASVQYFITFNHRYGSRTTLFKDQSDCDKYGILNYNHDGAVFPTWHRYFMLIWERMLSRIAHKLYGVTDFAMPYWDSAGLKMCDICNDKYVGGPGRRDRYGLRISEHHPFHNLSNFCHEPIRDLPCFGCQKAKEIGKLTRDWNRFDFATQDDWAFAVSKPHYFVAGERDIPTCESAHMAMEGYCGRRGDPAVMWTHNKMHNMLDGSMCCAGTATNDPLFPLHHTFTDKIFSIWYEKWRPKPSEYPNKSLRPGHCRDCFMVGFIPPVRNTDMFINTMSLGYHYDNQLIGQFAQNGRPPIRY